MAPPGIVAGMRRLAQSVAGLSVAAVLAVSGCGSSDNTSTPPASFGTPAAGPHNAADVAFAMNMIPHHAQAIAMADIALGTTSNDRVKALATSIKAAQEPELPQMDGWLKGWGKATPDTSMAGMSSSQGSGMMTAAEMGSLQKATGTVFDRRWLQMMTRHHLGAVATASKELSAGSNPDAKKLAQSIVDSQNAEITEMRRLLQAL